MKKATVYKIEKDAGVLPEGLKDGQIITSFAKAKNALKNEGESVTVSRTINGNYDGSRCAYITDGLRVQPTWVFEC